MQYTTFNFSNTEQIKLHGRCTKNSGSVVLSWSNCGFEFNFFGTGLVIAFDPHDPAEVAYLRVFVDGASARYALTTGDERICIDGLKEGVHNVKVLRITEGDDIISVKCVSLCGNSPYLTARPEDKKLKMEFYGDSITCGYGVMGSNSSRFYSYEEDSTRSYAYMTAELLGADARFMCSSGKGIVASCEGNRNAIKVSEFWKWTNPQGDLYDLTSWTPDVCVLNCGTNDAWGGVSDAEFTERGVKFLKDVREAYPNAKIIWAFGMMDETKLGAVEKAVSIFAEADKNVWFLPIKSMDRFGTAEIGGAHHPNTVASLRASRLLAQKIKDILSQ